MQHLDLFKRFLGTGYFPKELPPPFTTYAFSQLADVLLTKWQGDGRNGPRTRSDAFSIPRYGRTRRKLSIPNPISHYYLSKCVSDNWDSIIEHIGKSEITLFQPAQSAKATRVFDPIDFPGVESRKNAILSRCDNALAADVSRFYPTIYTHSIAWALHDKVWCKQNVNTATLKSSLGQQLDDLVRKGQDGQSLGIPLGLDTSIVLAEIIGSTIDQQLQKELGLTGDIAIRYTDDFFIGVRDGKTPETTLAVLSAALSTFELEIGSDKTRLAMAGTRAEPDWALELSQFRFPTDESRQRKALEFYFKTAFNLAQKNPSQNVLAYCVARAQSLM
jgi:hypothetical protein